MGNCFGNVLKLTIFGQSHGAAVGMTLEGFPVGFAPDFAALQRFLDRRAPGKNAFTSARCEADIPDFTSGLQNDCTSGEPLTALLSNTDVRSKDYENLKNTPRPSHADYPAWVKYGGQADMRGGGAFSGRMTAPLCVAGGLCLQWLERQGITVGAHLLQVGAVRDTAFDELTPQLPIVQGSLSLINPAVQEAMLAEIAAAKADGDSVGSIVECAAVGLPVGCGEPMFDGLENRLAQILFAIPAVKGVEFGSGFACAAMRGSTHNDPYYYDENGAVRTRSNHAGGCLGGLSTGMPLVLRAAFKPTASIARPQESICYDGGTATVQIQGRHDPCIGVRGTVCVEAAVAIALTDALLEAKLWT